MGPIRNDITRKVKWTAPAPRLHAGLNVIGKGYFFPEKNAAHRGHTHVDHVENMFAVEIESSL